MILVLVYQQLQKALRRRPFCTGARNSTWAACFATLAKASGIAPPVTAKAVAPPRAALRDMVMLTPHTLANCHISETLWAPAEQVRVDATFN